MLFCWKSVELLLIPLRPCFCLPYKPGKKTKNFGTLISTVAPDSNPHSQLKAAGLKLIESHLISVGAEWARSGSWDAELKYFHVPLKMTSPDHLVRAKITGSWSNKMLYCQFVLVFTVECIFCLEKVSFQVNGVENRVKRQPLDCPVFA